MGGKAGSPHALDSPALVKEKQGEEIMSIWWRTAALVCALGLTGMVQAASVARMSPQGAVSGARQITVVFAQPVAPFGDIRQEDPFTVNCQGDVPKGTGRWSTDKVWVYDFDDDVGPGVRCQVNSRAAWVPKLSAAGRLLATSFAFQTGGPFVRQIWPSGGELEEDQHFLLMLNGATDEASVQAHARCEVGGIGERLPVELVNGALRDKLLKQRGVQGTRAERTLLLRCQRPLPNGARMRLVWGAGIAAKGAPALVSQQPQVFDYRVRKAFVVNFSCERERAQSPCLPLRPLLVQFSSPVSRKLAEEVRLAPDSGAAIMPFFEKDDKADEVSEVRFMPPLPESSGFKIKLPSGLKDVAGRAVSNAEAFPLKVATSAMPPLAKFAAAPFGVIELYAEPGQAPLVPMTLRHVEKRLLVRGLDTGASVRTKTISTDADILRWMAKVRRYHESDFTAQELGRPRSQWTETVTETDEDGRTRHYQRPRRIGSRELSLLNDDHAAKPLTVPSVEDKDPRPFEVVGIPVAGPGYHVIEVASARLGQALLAKPAPMYVRTGVLVSNLGVHMKLGRDNALVWVTSLDKGQAVADADVAINNCRGERLWSGKTNAQGLAPVGLALTIDRERCLVSDGLFVTARKPITQGPYKGQTDMAFVFTDWQKGIESWRFNHPTLSPGEAYNRTSIRTHTVLDRNLLRAGETVSMKHFLRTETLSGFGELPRAQWPDTLKITHVGSGTEYTQPLTWPAGQQGRQALSSWKIPTEAQLGMYDITLEGNSPQGRQSLHGASFRVEEFRLPLVDARLSGPKDKLVAPKSVTLSAQLSYLSGGGVAQSPIKVTAVLRERNPSFAGYEEFSFQPPRPHHTTTGSDDEAEAEPGDQVVADKLPAVTDREGAARISLKDLPVRAAASELHAEMSFTDPNGEVQTVASNMPVWPSAVVLGVKSTRWAGTGGRDQGRVKFQVQALDTGGKPIKSQSVVVQARLSQTISTRKRIVGGFYAYDNRTEVKDLGRVCDGRTDERGLLLCEAVLEQAGEVELLAQTKDSEGRPAQAATSVWVTRQGELWFSQDNDDRMDVLPEKTSYEPGDTARLQVRMPFREATVLVSVEREGIIDTKVMSLSGQDPVIELPIPKGRHGQDGELMSWAPNVYVSVMALRGRIREVPWYSFFTWGWRSPMAWFKAFWYEGREYQAPTAMVDLSRPAYKLGVAALQIGRAEHALQVEVTTDKSQYTIRQTAKARIRVTQDGRPVQGEVAFAAVDEALLALSDNDSWHLLDGMLQSRPWAVETSTAQNEIVGRRHYGRKALPPGGGGGHGATRELFDTLLLWKGTVPLDHKGEALVDVPLNDALTSFRLVAVANSGLSRFGTGSTTIRVNQDLQMLSGLPPLVREGDQFEAIFTLRNTTSKPLRVSAQLNGQAQSMAPGRPDVVIKLPPIELDIAADGAREARWTVDVPAGVKSLQWLASAAAQGGMGAPADKLKVQQQVTPAVPVRVMQASLQQLSAPFTMSLAPPPDAVADARGEGAQARGGIRLGLQPKLTGALPGIRRFFEQYPFVCLEQKASKSIGLKDADMWAGVARQLPSYLDSDGLVSYFPPMSGDAAHGSDTLTAYVLAATHEAGFELPPQARDAMLGGLSAFVQGRVQRASWIPPGRAANLMLDVRRLAALEALSRYGRAEPRMLDSITLAPNTWPTAAVINWFNILQRVKAVPDRDKRLTEAEQILRARLTYAGTTLKFSTEEDDFWWWLMDNADANAARLILSVMELPAWQDDMPRLVQGALARQKRGAWLTTNANLWASLALDKFGQRFERVPVAGVTSARLADAVTTHEWARAPEGSSMNLPWPIGDAKGNAPVSSPLIVKHEGAGRPWLTVQALSAIPLKAPLRAGYAVNKSVSLMDGDKASPVKPGQRLARGSVLRIRLEVDAQADMTWVVVSDPVPGGTTILGSGLGRDSELASQGEKTEGMWPVYVERAFDAWRGYFDFMPKGHHVVEYTVRLNNPGRFNMPQTRVEAMYAPESFGEWPNATVEVGP